ncbi:MAG: ATP-binding protein [Gammaproteobacteria bacterium]
MSSSDTDNVPYTDGSGQSGAARHVKNRPHVVRGQDRRRREIDVADDRRIISREELVTSREDAADLREDAVHLHEGAVSLREQDVRAAETIQAASDDHMMMLQHVNERLVITTIEAQKLAEQLQATKDQLERAKSVAETANLAKSAFLTSMSHELRTPLNSILGFAQLLEAGTPPPTPTQNARLQQIIKAGWYLLELITQILDLTKIESGQVSLSRESVALIEVIRDCQAMIEPQAQQRGIQINFLPFDPNWHANVDRIRVKQALVNLLSNAIKYNRAQGTVEVKCSLSTPDRIRISVKDSGAGLPPEKLAQLFQPFNRLGQENGPEEGTGIGLVVTKQLVELMGGSVGVESTVGMGSEFWIELTGDVMPQLAAESAMPTLPPPLAQVNMAQCTLLYVEDNPVNLMLVEQIMEAYPQIHMLSAIDGYRGIKLATTQLPDVILMDVNLPDITGFEALRILREDPVTKHIPIIALSANAMQHDVEKGLETGFFSYLTKPIKVNELMEMLHRALNFSETGLGDATKPGPL